MKAAVVAVTTTDKKNIEKIRKENFELDGGHSANICYTEKDWDEIVEESYDKTINRINGNKSNNHHSVFGHDEISLYFTGIPKLLAMLLNNEHEYNTSEKSARYTKMAPIKEELEIYEKWIKILQYMQLANVELADKRISFHIRNHLPYILMVLVLLHYPMTIGQQWH